MTPCVMAPELGPPASLILVTSAGPSRWACLSDLGISNIISNIISEYMFEIKPSGLV